MGAESVGGSGRKPTFGRQVRGLKVGTRVEVVWVDASQAELEEGRAGEMGGLQLLRSVGYVSSVDRDQVVLVRNLSFMDDSHRGSETIPVANVVVVDRLRVEETVATSGWYQRPWVRELMRGAGGQDRG